MRLIDADEAYKILMDYYHIRMSIQQLALKEALERVPTIEAEPTKHGKWKHIPQPYKGADFGFYQCSVCGDAWWFITKYCANCGAKMYEEEVE